MPELENKVHERYARCRAQGLNKTDSYRKAAGDRELTINTCHSYSCAVEKRPEVERRIRELEVGDFGSPEEKVSIKKEWVIERLKTIVDRCMQAEPVRTARGKPVGVCHRCGEEIDTLFKFLPEPAIRALTQIGLELEMFAKRVTHEHVAMIEGDFLKMAGRLVTLLEALGQPMVIEVVNQLGFKGDRKPLRAVDSADDGAGGDGEADPLALPAPSEAG